MLLQSRFPCSQRNTPPFPRKCQFPGTYLFEYVKPRQVCVCTRTTYHSNPCVQESKNPRWTLWFLDSWVHLRFAQRALCKSWFFDESKVLVVCTCICTYQELLNSQNKNPRRIHIYIYNIHHVYMYINPLSPKATQNIKNNIRKWS